MNIKMSTAAAVYNNYIYFSACDFNGLMRTDIKTGKTEYICRFEKEDDVDYLHMKAFIFGNEIWFTPGYGEYIACVNVETMDILYFEFPYKTLNEQYKTNSSFYKNGKTRLKSLDAGRYEDNKIFVISACADTVIVIDMSNKEILSYYNVINTQTEVMGYGAILKNTLWMVPYVGECLVALNLEDETVSRVKMDSSIKGCKSLCCVEGKVWFAPRKSDYVVYYDVNEGEYCKVYDEKKSWFHKDYWYKDIIEYNNEVWVLPGNGKEIVSINPKTFEMKRIVYDTKMANQMRIDADVEGLHMISNVTSCVSKIKEDFKEIQFVQIQISDADFLGILEKIYGENAFRKYYDSMSGKISESRIGLKKFLFLLNEIAYKEEGSVSKRIGNDIWQNTV